MRITWLGHSAFLFESNGKRVVIDPFISANPAFPKGQNVSLDRVDYLLLTHLHFDHVGDALTLSKGASKRKL